MTIGSITGCMNGLDGGVGGAIKNSIINIVGTPDAVVAGVYPSGLAWDSTAGQLYMFYTGSTWIKLGSVS